MGRANSGYATNLLIANCLLTLAAILSVCDHAKKAEISASVPENTSKRTGRSNSGIRRS
jgi:hypothetical protein